LIDSGILQRVRELKYQFGASLYHPRVLATVAVYKLIFRAAVLMNSFGMPRRNQGLCAKGAAGRRQHYEPRGRRRQPSRT